ncbi:MAG: TolC family protein [Verrucomicrobia bacterium]|nr:TolC family protein [Verrucomicrobiota bacterium]
MKRLFVTVISALLLCGHVGSAEDSLENLTLEQALALAEARHPLLREANANIAAAGGRVTQAGAFPNPEAIVRVESAPFDGKGDPEYLVGFSQRIPINGSIGKAREVESRDQERLRNELEVTRLTVRKKVHGAFATALYQEAAFNTLDAIRQHLSNGAEIAKARVEVGDALSEDLARSEMELRWSELDLRQAKALREQALLELADALGEPSSKIGSLSGNINEVLELASLERISANLSAHPEIAAAQADVDLQRARVALAKAERVPDLNVEVLYRRIVEEKRNSADFGISVPLPLFNRNSGRVREAEAGVTAAEARSAKKRSDLAVNLRQLESQLAEALHRARLLQDEIMPRARKVLNAAEARYKEGDVSLSDVLPARRDWALVQMAQLEALREVMSAWAGLSVFARR